MIVSWQLDETRALNQSRHIAPLLETRHTVASAVKYQSGVPRAASLGGVASGNLEQVALPADIKSVVVLADNDGTRFCAVPC
jgi:hypothetical protein